MKYETEINQLFEDVLRDPDMSDETWTLLKQLIQSHPSFNLEKLGDDIEIGIANGYSLKDQMDLCRDLLKGMRD